MHAAPKPHPDGALRLPLTQAPPCLSLPGLAGLQVDYATFSELYADIFTPIQPLIAQQQLLASAGWPTYLLSNCRCMPVHQAWSASSLLQPCCKECAL